MSDAMDWTPARQEQESRKPKSRQVAKWVVKEVVLEYRMSKGLCLDCGHEGHRLGSSLSPIERPRAGGTLFLSEIINPISLAFG